MRRSFPTSFSGFLGKLFAFLLWKRWRASTSAFRAPKLSGFYSCWSFALLFGVRGRPSTNPVAMSTTGLAAWEKSLGRLQRLRLVAPPSLSHRWRDF